MAIKKLSLAVIILAFIAVTGLAVFAQETSAKAKQVDIACVKSAVTKREDAVLTAWQKLSDSINSALQARKTKLIAAWDITDKKERNKAVQAAWTGFKESKKNAVNSFRQEKLAAWQQFKSDVKSCGTLSTGENQGSDISL